MTADAVDVFVIDSRHHKKDAGLVVCMLLWGLGVGAFVAITLVSDLYGFAIAGACLLLPVLVWIIMTRRTIEVIELGQDGLTITRNHRTASAVQISKGTPLKLTLEHVEIAGDPYQESLMSLNLWDDQRGYWRRTLLGQWIHLREKERVFGELLQFLKRHGYQVEARNDLANKREVADMQATPHGG